MSDFEIDPDIRRASTLRAEAYRDPRLYAVQLERIFARSWQLVPAARQVATPGDVRPWTLLEGSLDEPLVLTRDEQGRLFCLSNVCTHRANLVVTEAGTAKSLRCGYHGRRFGLDGQFLSMPEFEEAQNFPTNADNLPVLPLAHWGPFTFVGLATEFGFDEWIAPLRSRHAMLPVDRLVPDADDTREYVLGANWALYCDNYLEGFHIPFVHAGLAKTLDYGSYKTETFAWASLQVGVARDGETAFELPEGHPDHGTRIAAYYWFLFPNLMLNLYPWGISVNVVEPLGVDRTRVRFLSWVWDPSLRDHGAGSDLHRVEMEDEAVVESVQRGVRSRLYRRGRYSPSREVGVHHFHRLLARYLAVKKP